MRTLNTKILLSLASVAAVGVVAIGGTYANFTATPTAATDASERRILELSVRITCPFRGGSFGQDKRARGAESLGVGQGKSSV